MKLLPDNTNDESRKIYIQAISGSIKDVSLILFEELQNTGYSLLLSDVESAVINSAQKYAIWAVLEEQRKTKTVMLVNKDLIIHGYEWEIMHPLVRAHCDLLQARLVEGSRSMGGDGFGLTVSEADQKFVDAQLKLERDANYLPPFCFKTAEGN